MMQTRSDTDDFEFEYATGRQGTLRGATTSWHEQAFLPDRLQSIDAVAMNAMTIDAENTQESRSPERAAVGAAVGTVVGAGLGYWMGMYELEVRGIGAIFTEGPLVAACSIAMVTGGIGGIVGLIRDVTEKRRIGQRANRALSPISLSQK